MKTILVVEDDRIYARTTANWLVKTGWMPVTCCQ